MVTKEICRSCNLENNWAKQCGVKPFNDEYAFYELKMTDCVRVGKEEPPYYLCKKHLDKLITFYTNLRKEFDGL